MPATSPGAIKREEDKKHGEEVDPRPGEEGSPQASEEGNQKAGKRDEVGGSEEEVDDDVAEGADAFSTGTSAATRYFATAGMAVVWILAESVQGLRSLALTVPLVFFAATLWADFMHYSRATSASMDAIEKGLGRKLSPAEWATECKNIRKRATTWFKVKKGLAIGGSIALIWAYVCIVYPEVPRWFGWPC